MTEYTFPLNAGLQRKQTAVHRFGTAQADDCGCCRPVEICCPCLIPGPAGPAGPAGETGPAGPAGPAGETPTFTVGTVTAGDTPAVTITGDAPDYVLNFVLPTAVPPAN